MEFGEQEYKDDSSIRLGGIPSLDTSSLKDSSEPYPVFRDVRRRVISVLQDRSYPVWKRLLMLGHLIETLEAGDNDGLLTNFLAAFAGGSA